MARVYLTLAEHRIARYRAHRKVSGFGAVVCRTEVLSRVGFA